MIIITVSMWSARTKRVTCLGRAVIHNVSDGSGDRPGLNDYAVAVGRRPANGKPPAPERVLERPLRTGSVTSYPSAAYNMWRLIIRGLLSAFPEEKRTR